jgi:hypothetical protein
MHHQGNITNSTSYLSHHPHPILCLPSLAPLLLSSLLSLPLPCISLSLSPLLLLCPLSPSPPRPLCPASPSLLLSLPSPPLPLLSPPSLSYPLCPVLSVLSSLSCPLCPILSVLSCPLCPALSGGDGSFPNGKQRYCCQEKEKS